MKNIGELFDFAHGGRGAVLPTNGVMMAKQGAGGGRTALAIAIGRDTMAAVRWVTGDRITIDLDCACSELTLRRVVPADNSVVSWKLSHRSGEKGARPGQTAAATVKITATDLMLKAFGMDDAETPYVPDVVVTGEKGITFAMRKPWTVTQKARR